MQIWQIVPSRNFSLSHPCAWWLVAPHDMPGAAVVAGNHYNHVRNGEIKDNQTGVSRRIYMLGWGRVGAFVAHSLALIPNRPPITLLFHRQSLLAAWNKHGRAIEVYQHGVPEKRDGFDVEMERHSDQRAPSNTENTSIIHNLIVSVKGHTTVAALSNIAHRLTSESTILFLQNGMGIVDEVNDKVFTCKTSRPRYMLGIVTHGLRLVAPFATSHHGVGAIALGLISDESVIPSSFAQRDGSRLPPSSRYLLRTLTRTPNLAAMGLAPLELLQLQFEKLAVNAVINPLTVILDCKNGELLSNFAVTRVMRLLLSEITVVIRSMPELQHVPNLNSRFSTAKLEYQIVSTAKKTSSNESSMLQDFKSGKETEIDYINGYLIRRCEGLGIHCVMNYMLMQMVKGKHQIGEKRAADLLPLQTV